MCFHNGYSVNTFIIDCIHVVRISIYACQTSSVYQWSMLVVLPKCLNKKSLYLIKLFSQKRVNWEWKHSIIYSNSFFSETIKNCCKSYPKKKRLHPVQSNIIWSHSDTSIKKKPNLLSHLYIITLWSYQIRTISCHTFLLFKINRFVICPKTKWLTSETFFIPFAGILFCVWPSNVSLFDSNEQTVLSVKSSILNYAVKWGLLALISTVYIRIFVEANCIHSF